MNLETTITRSEGLTTQGAADLAHRLPFEIGQLLVEPALLRLSARGGSLTLQPLAMRVLLALCEAQGDTCSRDDLVDACWNQRIVGDDAVHRVISTLRRDLAQLTQSSVAIETIPKVGYRLRVDDIRPDTGGAANDQPRQKRPQKTWAVGILVTAGLVAAGLFAASGGKPEVTAIAVVPDTQAGDVASANFANGLTGDLARLASAMPSLSFVEEGGEGTEEPLLLRVALDSQAESTTARVRLIDRGGGAVVWSRDFTAESGTIAELRELVSNGVTGVIQCGLDRSAQFDDPIGLRLYLGACEGLETEDFDRARMFAQQITEFRPSSPAGWACLANTTIFAAAQEGPVDHRVLARAEAYARRALAVDPTSGLAYVALAMAASWRGEPVLDILERGIEVDPDFAMLQKHYAQALTATGMASAAVDPALRAVALHPHNPLHYRIAIWALVNAGRLEEAIALSDRMQRLWRFDRSMAAQRLALSFYSQDAQAALAAFTASDVRQDPRTEIIGQSLAWRANPEGYDWADFDRVAQRAYARDTKLAWQISATAARMGDQARALAWLDRAPTEAFMAWAPMFAPDVAVLRRDPRFFAKMARVGMVSRWQTSARWPDFCSDPALGYDCRRQARLSAQSAG